MASAQQAFQLKKFGQRVFSMQHPTASRAFATAFDQRRTASLNRLSTMCLQTLSTIPDLFGNLRFR